MAPLHTEYHNNKNMENIQLCNSWTASLALKDWLFAPSLFPFPPKGTAQNVQDFVCSQGNYLFSLVFFTLSSSNQNRF